jgi:phosphoglycolate phosphatase
MSEAVRAPAAILFDLDGALVDSVPCLVRCFRHAFESLGLPAPAEADVRAQIGLPLEARFARFAPGQVPALCAAYRDHYPRVFARECVVFPGVSTLLARLRERGYRLGIATTKRTPWARRFVEGMGLAPHVDCVQGTDDFPHKPAPDVLLRALAALGCEGRWMVGDTPGDVLAGRAAGLSTYAVCWGGPAPGDLVTAAPRRARARPRPARRDAAVMAPQRRAKIVGERAGAA